MSRHKLPPTLPTPPTDGLMFDLGQLVITPGIRDSGLTAGQLDRLLRRHCLAVWDMSEADSAANMAAIANSARVFGTFDIDGMHVWIITEADRSSTCVLLPSEY